MLHEPGGRFHDHGHAGLVVGAQQRGAVGGDQGPADQVLQFRVVGHANHPARVARQHQVAAPIIADHLRLDALAGGFRRSVQVGTEGDGRAAAAAVARHGGQHDPVLVLPASAMPRPAAPAPAAAQSICPGELG